MATYIYGVQNGTHLIDLVKISKCLENANKLLEKVRADGKCVLFVGTRDQIACSIEERARASKSFFVTERWLGGILTNWSTIRTSLLKFHHLELAKKKGIWANLSKRDLAFREKRLERLKRYLGGLKGIRSLPGALVLVGQMSELASLRECSKLGIPVICRVDTDCDPSLAEIRVPINDDSREGVCLFLNALVPAIHDGSLQRKSI
jgi:small subunit ribosomal protein S2